MRDTHEAAAASAPERDHERAEEHERDRALDPVALRAASELRPDRRAAGSVTAAGGGVPRAPITVLCPHCSHACDPAAGIACVRCGAYVGAGIAELRRDEHDAPPARRESPVARPANDPGPDTTDSTDGPGATATGREPSEPGATEPAATPEPARATTPADPADVWAPQLPPDSHAPPTPAPPATPPTSHAKPLAPKTPDPELLAGFAQIGRAAASVTPVAPRVVPPAAVPPLRPTHPEIEPVAPISTEAFVVRTRHTRDNTTNPATLPGRRRFGRRPPGLHSSELRAPHNWVRTVTTLALLVAIAVVAGRIMFNEDPANEPILGSSAGADVIDPTDRADARPASPGGETTLLQIHRVITSIARNGEGWSSVTPGAIGTSIDAIGILGPERPPTRVDEVSLAIDPDRGVTLGAFDSDVATGDCVWLRDTGNGPDVARDQGSGNCTAAAAPMAGWEPILP